MYLEIILEVLLLFYHSNGYYYATYIFDYMSSSIFDALTSSVGPPVCVRYT